MPDICMSVLVSTLKRPLRHCGNRMVTGDEPCVSSVKLVLL